MQHSLFEPLYSFQAHTMGKCQLAPKAQAPSPSLFIINPPSPSSPPHPLNIENTPSCLDPQDISCSFLDEHIIKPSSGSSYKKARSEQDLTSDVTHVNPPLPHSTASAASSSLCSVSHNSSLSKRPLSHPITFFTTTAPPTACSNCVNANDHKCDDNGSVASKLLSSLTKSISSPSLHLASSKEAARETPFQKALKLKQMKLQHCAEALGMESLDNSSFLYHDSQLVHLQEKIDMLGNSYSLTPSFTPPSLHQEGSLKSVRSLPNLSNTLPLMPNHSRYSRSTSFPPPLSHTLPTSSSSDSLSLSLRAYREDGRFILKQTMVPSKHYFHSHRKDGRLTLRVITREEETEVDEDNFARQDDHEEFSCRVEFQEVSLAELEDEVCAKKSIAMHTSKEINVAGRHLDISLQRLNCIAHHHNHINEYSEQDDKSNVISNVITLSLQGCSHSKLTLHKAQVLRYPLLSSSLQQSALIHSSKGNHGFLSGNHDMNTSPQSKQNFIWESNVMPCTAVVASGSIQSLQRKGNTGSHHGGGVGGGAAKVPAFVMEEMKAKSLMKAVSELATSFILEANYCNGGDWCLAGEKKPLLTAGEGGESGTIIGGYASAIENAINNNKVRIGEDGQISHGANSGYNTSYFKEEEQATSEGGKELNITSSPLNVDSQFSSCNGNLQCEERLHTLHCKELFDRHRLCHGLMKLPCIPTRS